MIAPATLLLSGMLLAQIPDAASQESADSALRARTSFEGPALELDFPALHIGVAEYDEGPTGATVFYFPHKVMAAVDVRGGAPGTINADALRLGYEHRMIDAVVFAGGSWYGLAAGTGVADEIKMRTADPGHWENIAGVVAAIIFDLGDRRFTTVTPDYDLGRAALRAAKPGRFPLGSRGAGRFAMQGGYFAYDESLADWPHSGQGGAFRQIGPTKIAVFTVVNAGGSIVDRDGNVARCRGAVRPYRCGSIAERLERMAEHVSQVVTSQQPSGEASQDENGPTKNTTITLVVTNQKLPFWALQRLAVQVHTSMGRAIQPFSTESDGDVLYAVTTAEVENPALTTVDLGVIASEVAWDAVLSSVPQLDAPLSGKRIRVGDKALDAFAGQYELAPGARLRVRRDAGRLLGESIGKGSIYFPRDEEFEMTPVGEDLFLLQTPRRDHIRFERAGDRVVGLTLNPGQWSQQAERVRE
jgi:L-aminopeptidase/D-esterase-like protein